jgi:DnaJ-class molecular chaperone
MKLEYFKITDSLEDLKHKRRQYALQLHPDKHSTEAAKKTASAKFVKMNAEYEYAIDPKNRIPVMRPSAGGPIFTPGRNPKSKTYSEKNIRQAQDLFHALSNGSGVDWDLFIGTSNAINSWTEVLKIYQIKYGETLKTHLTYYIKNKDFESQIIDFINGRLVKERTEGDPLFQFISHLFKF